MLLAALVTASATVPQSLTTAMYIRTPSQTGGVVENQRAVCCVFLPKRIPDSLVWEGLAMPVPILAD